MDHTNRDGRRRRADSHPETPVCEFVESTIGEDAAKLDVRVEPTTCGQETVESAAQGMLSLPRAEFDSTAEGSTEIPLSSASPSRFLGDYELLGEIGRGGMAIVYRARQVKLGRLVALKVIRDHNLAGMSELRRFRSEAEVIAELDHPNIVPIYEVGQVDGLPFFSMKLFNGGNVSSQSAHLKEDPRAAASLIAKVASAVHFAHQRAILHRDIKPSNILLDERGEPYVSDFGLAKRLERRDASTATLDGAIMGTPAYMPPEQARGEIRTLTTAADVYSLGATLFELVTGQPPFEGGSLANILRQVHEEEAPRPRTLNPGIDRDLETICLKCLQKEPAARYQSAAALAEDLQRWLTGRPILARPVSFSERALKWVRRRRTVAALLLVSAVSLLTAIVVCIWFMFQLAAALDSAEAQAYATDMNLSLRDWSDHKPLLALDRLDKYRHPAWWWQTDRRGFEWDLLNRLCRPRELRGHKGTVRSIAFHRSGRLLASCGADYLLHIWDLTTGEVRATRRHDRVPQALVMSPDGKWVASGGQDKQVAIRHSETLDEHYTLGPLPHAVWDIVFSPDSRRIAFSFGWEVRVVDIESKRDAYPPINLPPSSVQAQLRSRALTFSRDGRLLAVSSGAEILICSAETGEVVLSPLKGHVGAISSLAFGAEDRLLASGSEDGSIRVWDPKRRFLPHILDGHTGNINQVAFSRDGKILASASSDKSARFWDVETGREERIFPHPNDVQGVAFHPDGERMATACGDGVIRIWDISDRQSRLLGEHRDAVVGVAVRPDGQQIASISSDGSLQLRDLEPGLQVGQPTIEELPFVPVAVTYHPDGRHLAISGREGQIRIMDLQDRNSILLEDEKKVSIQGLAFSHDRRSLAAVGAEGAVRIWDWRQQRVARSLLGYEGSVLAVVFSPDGRRLATGGGDKIVRLWDPETGGERRLGEHEGFILALAFSPDGQFLASAGQDHVVRLWDLRGWRISSRTLKGHSGPVNSLAFSRVGSLRVASAGKDGTIKLWDTQTGIEILTLAGHAGEVTAVAFDSEGRYLVSAGSDRTVLLWIAGPR